MNKIIRFILIFLAFYFILRFSSYILYFLLRYWYISLAFIGYFLYKMSKKKSQTEQFKKNNLDPDKEIKPDKEPIIEDEEKENI